MKGRYTLEVAEDSSVDSGRLFKCASASVVLLTANLTRGPKKNNVKEQKATSASISILHAMLQDPLRIVKHPNRQPLQCVGF